MTPIKRATALLALLASYATAAFPDTPFTTNGRSIISASGATVNLAGVNWPGAADTMLPEGLQYRSIADIVSSIKSLGMNVIRLTYAIEMVDDILGNSPNQGLQNTLIHALGQDNGTAVFQQIIKHNPSLTADTTRLEVFDAVAAECARQEIWVHLDNHVSKAEWCCSMDDGNAWYNDLYFNPYNWQRGLGYMASHAKSWPALSSMSLHNELRQPTSSGNQADGYDWYHWALNSVPAMDGINGNNSLPLIFLSGLNYDTDDTAIANGQNLGQDTYFNLNDFSYRDKIVYELHNYQNSATDCASIKSGLVSNGYGIMDLSNTGFPNHAPMVMTEFGFDQGSGSTSVYGECIKSFLTEDVKKYAPGEAGGWMMWVISGSYYIRTGSQDQDESWGLFNHDWSAWRNQTVIDDYVKPFVQATV